MEGFIVKSYQRVNVSKQKNKVKIIAIDFSIYMNNDEK